MLNCPATIQQLVERFSMHREAYHAAGYNETQLRREFLDPFFEALGWDVDNKQNFHEAYKEVIHEDSIKIGEWTKAPDYCFRIGGVRKFFVEAKKPAVNIKDDVGSAYQVRRYAWSAKLPLSILTNFEGFAVYDCRQRPNPNDNAAVGRVLFMSWTEYETRWDEIASVFSREAIPRGGFDKYADSTKAKRGTAEVDDAFLDDIELWRKSLASNLAMRNPSLAQRDLNFAVQRTIDRIVFLRICEDRGIEQYGSLQALLGGANVYARLAQLFHAADRRYNSGLFHFQKENDRAEPPDDLTLELAIDDKALKDIIKRLYYPECPYAFSVLGADILGHIYEQFLGKVIRLTAGHHAVVEDKPEVKKAGGVYYTPTYIVDYIVKQTVGTLLEGKSPQDISGKGRVPFSILDPACGSGSFLIGAYQYLLNWHLDWYFRNDPDKWCAGKSPALSKSGTDVAGGGYRLSTSERKRILTTHIFGVDIDAQAVETTKLSLLLKVLEGENDTSIKSQLTFFHARALPDLGANIKCGNSLIGSDFYDGQNLSLFDDNIKQRINAFDWKQEFPVIMRSGGFDIVVGNPPYIKIQTLSETNPEAAMEIRKRFESASSGSFDLYVAFIEQASKLLNDNSRMGFIVPHKWMNSTYGAALREYLRSNQLVSMLLHFGDKQVFKNATTYTCLLFLQRPSTEDLHVSKIGEQLQPQEFLNSAEFSVQPRERWGERDWNIQGVSASNMLDRFAELPTLADVTTNIFQGPKAGADNAFILRFVKSDGKFSTGISKLLGVEVKLEASILKDYVKGKNIRRYQINRSDHEVTIFPYDSSGMLMSAELLKDKFPLVWKYFNEGAVKKVLCDREEGRFANQWWAYSRPQNMRILFDRKILTPFNAFGPSFCLDESHDFVFSAGVSGAYGIVLKPGCAFSYEYLLAILNSSLSFYVIKNISTALRGGFYSFENKYIKQLPICALDPRQLAQKSNHDNLSQLAKQAMNLRAQSILSKNPDDLTRLQREIAAIDAAIDRLVYVLYCLTEDEVRLLEKGSS